MNSYNLNNKIFLTIFLIVTASYSSIALAEDNPWTHTFYFENDLFNGTDSNYTNGVKYSIISPDLSPHAPDGKLPRRALEYIHKIPFIGKSGPEYTHKVEFSFGQNMCTPSNIKRSDLIEDDRPYAGWTYLSTSYHRKHKAKDNTTSFMDTVEMQFGLIGHASLADETQKFVHKLRDIQRPNGWHHQLKNEPVIAIVFERKWLFHPGKPRAFGFDAITHAGAALGNVYTYLNGGFEIRFGWNIPESFGVSLIRPAGSTQLVIGREFSIFTFGAVNSRIIARDVFLDGNTFRDSHSVDKKNMVTDIAGGLAINFRNFIVTWTQVLRTKEFKVQDNEHSFGSIALSFSFPFDLRKILLP